MRRASVVAVVLIAGCGAKTSLRTGAAAPIELDSSVPLDVGVDSEHLDVPWIDIGPRDVGVDSGPPPLEVFCEPRLLATRPRSTVNFGARVEGMEPAVRTEWSVAGPRGSSPGLTVMSDADVALFVDVEGEYVATFAATAPGGRTFSCETRVVVNNGEPVIRCPAEELLVFHGESIVVETPAADDDGIVSIDWEIAAGPPRHSSQLGEQVGDFQIEFLAGLGFDNAGGYQVLAVVQDTDGATAECATRVRVIHPPVLECPPPQEVPTRQPTNIAVSGFDDVGIVEHLWTVRSTPTPDADARLRPRENQAQVRLSRQGEYQLEYVAVDGDGLRSGCIVTLFGTPTPPTLTCPERVQTTPLTDTPVEVSAEDDGVDLMYRWQLEERPDGSDASPPRPNAARTIFRPDVAGEYLLSVNVVDEDGMGDSCEIVVAAVASEGLRVEISWSTSGSDMDLHLLHPDAMRWNSNLDCYYANCNSSSGSVLDWETPSRDDDPRLDIDDTNGFGPENINIDEPVPQTYTVGVHAFGGSGVVTARIYCGGSTTTPRAEFTQAISDNSGNRSRDHWRVADVRLNADGTCSVLERHSPNGGADIISDREMNRGR